MEDAIDDIGRFVSDIRSTINNADLTDENGRFDMRRDVEIRLQNIEGKIAELRRKQ